jgi:hypothetical protein
MPVVVTYDRCGAACGILIGCCMAGGECEASAIESFVVGDTSSIVSCRTRGKVPIGLPSDVSIKDCWYDLSMTRHHIYE